MLPHDSPAHDTRAVTELLAEASGGNIAALNDLFPLVYDELRRIAHARLRPERDGHTLNTTALVHEAYLKLVGQNRVEWQSRAHFYAVASQAMRRILINYAQARRAAKRGGGAREVPLDAVMVAFRDEQIDELLAIDEALTRLKSFNPRGADVVVYRFFGGLDHEEIAQVMDVSTITVRRAWTVAKAWLRHELSDGAADWAGSRLTGPGGASH